MGIGGIGMSALAAIFKTYGKQVTGSDREDSKSLHELQKLGIQTMAKHALENIKSKPDLIIYSLAIPATNPEIRQARLKKIPLLSYPEAVGLLTKQFFTIAVCGTHGKSTITALLAKIFIENNFDPTVIVGTKLKELGGANYRVGKSKLLILEACEYKRAFFEYLPHIVVLHTLDPDHMDYYKNWEEYLDAFRSFVGQLPADGYFFGSLDDDDVHQIMQHLQSKKFPSYNCFTYSAKYSHADFYLEGSTLFRHNEKRGTLALKIPGMHNRTNALAAFSVACSLGIAPKDILKSLEGYTGAFRRFEMKGKIGKTTIIDDYGHHPVEIEATLQAAREKFPKAKICLVFQPHQYSRTKNLLKEFGQSFGGADEVIIPNIYEARDTMEDKRAVSPQQLVKTIQEYHKNPRGIRYGDGLANTVALLKKQHHKFDVIFTMGAGDVWKVAEALLKK